jgi:integrase
MEEAAESYENNGLVFCNEIGQPIRPDGFSKSFKRVIERYNRRIEKEWKVKDKPITEIEKEKIPVVKLHALRHTFATLCLQQGTDPRTIQEAFGHYKVSFTLDVYSGVTNKMRQDATEKIGTLMVSCLD